MEEVPSQTQSASATDNVTAAEFEPESPSVPAAGDALNTENIANGAGAPTENTNSNKADSPSNSNANDNDNDNDNNNSSNSNSHAAESANVSATPNANANAGDELNITELETEKAKSETQETDKPSSLKSDRNPLTIARQKAASEGRPLMVNFDERVVVHTVPYWDPCGETFNDTDDEDGPRGPNCCAIL